MSRYDYRDPGTDPAYCDGLSVVCPSVDCDCPSCVTDRVVRCIYCHQPNDRYMESDYCSTECAVRAETEK